MTKLLTCFESNSIVQDDIFNIFSNKKYKKLKFLV